MSDPLSERPSVTKRHLLENGPMNVRVHIQTFPNDDPRRGP